MLKGFFETKISKYAARFIALGESGELGPADRNEMATMIGELEELINRAPEDLVSSCSDLLARLIESVRADYALSLMATIENKDASIIRAMCVANENIYCRIAHTRKAEDLAKLFNPKRLELLMRTSKRILGEPV